MSIFSGESSGADPNNVGGRVLGQPRVLDLGTDQTFEAYRLLNSPDLSWDAQDNFETEDASPRKLEIADGPISIAEDLVGGFNEFIAGRTESFSIYFLHNTAPLHSSNNDSAKEKAAFERRLAERVSHAQIEKSFVDGLRSLGIKVSDEALRDLPASESTRTVTVCRIGNASLELQIERPCPDYESHRYTGMMSEE